jgi:myosin-crossreactive antigen
VICSSVEAGSSEEAWVWVEEYADRDAYDAFYRALEEDRAFLEIHDKKYDFWHLIVEGSFKGELYTERARF